MTQPSIKYRGIIRMEEPKNEAQIKTPNTLITIACMAFFPLLYFLGSTLLNWLNM